MSDFNLLSVGCVVTFISIAGVYVYLRESYAKHQQDIDEKDQVRSEDKSPSREAA
jgi:hypothetical protein